MSAHPLDPRRFDPSRRSIMKAGAAFTAATFLAGRSFAQDAANAEKQSTAPPKPKLPPIRVGLLGCGGRGTGAAADALEADTGVVITALGDVLLDRLEKCESTLAELHPERVRVDPAHRFVGFDACEKMLASGIDVILLATPPVFRPAQLTASVAAGKHIFCEKPVAVDAPGIRTVLAAVEESKKKKLALVSGFCWRSSLREREAMKRVHAGEIGAIRALYHTYYASPNGIAKRQPAWSDMEWQIRNWYHFPWLSGDHVVEQAVHSVDKMAWAMQDEPPLSCVAIGGRQTRTGPESGYCYDHFGVTYDYKNGAKGFLMCRQWEGCYGDNTDTILGETGICRIEGWVPKHTIEGAHPWSCELEGNNMYVAEHEELFTGIRSGNVRNDGTWATQSVLMAIMGRMAAYTGDVITWERALASVEKLGPDHYAFGEVAVPTVAVPGITKFA